MNYRFEALTLTSEELSAIKGLFEKVWPKTKRLTADFLDWQYRQNPNGGAIGFNAYSDSPNGTSQIVAHYAVIPQKSIINQTIVNSALSLNTAVDEGHRGKGLFKILAEKTYAQAAQKNISQIFGVANANSTPGFVKSLNFQLVTPLDVKGICLSTTLLQNNVPVWQTKWSPESLSWRLQNPAAKYWFESNSQHGLVAGPTKYLGVSGILYHCKSRAESELCKSILPIASTLRPKIWFGKSPQISTRYSLTVPQILRPSPFNLIFRDLVGNAKLDVASIHFEAIDFDVM